MTTVREVEQGLVAEALRRVPLFGSLNAQQIQEVARVARRHRYARDEVVFYQGDAGDTFYVILSGQVKVSVSSAEGQEAILVMLDSGESFGEFALLDEQPRSASIQATRPTDVVALRKDDFQRLIKQSPDIAISLLKVMTKRLRDTDQLVEDAAFLDVAERLAKKLLSLMDVHGKPSPRGIELDMHLTQQELAAMIGATRESVNKALATLTRRGLVVRSGKRYVVSDVEQLRSHAH